MKRMRSFRVLRVFYTRLLALFALLMASGVCGPVTLAQEGSSAGGAVFVLGGNRGTGLEIVKLLRLRNEDVTVLVRTTSDVTALQDTGATMVTGDAMVKATLDAGLSGGPYRLFISTINGRTPSGERADAAGNVNAIDAAKAAGVPHFVLLSTIGAGDSFGALPPPLRTVLQGSVDAKNIAERHLLQSGLAYTIIRPGGLTDDPPNGRGFLTDDQSVLSSIGRAELAALVVNSLYDPAARNKTYTAVEP